MYGRLINKMDIYGKLFRQFNQANINVKIYILYRNLPQSKTHIWMYRPNKQIIIPIKLFIKLFKQIELST